MRLWLILRCCALAAFATSQSAWAMPKIPAELPSSKQVNILIQQQTSHWENAKFSEALRVNILIRNRLNKNPKRLALYIAQAEIDQSLISYRAGNKKQALTLMKRLQSNGTVRRLLDEFKQVGVKEQLNKAAYLAYYEVIQHSYIEWLRKANDPELASSLTRLVADVEEARTLHQPGVSSAGIVDYALQLRKDKGDIEGAKRICEDNIRWLKSVNPNEHEYWGLKDYRLTVFVSDDYVYDWALKIATFKSDYSYALGEGYDDCADLAEYEGREEIALEWRLLSRGFIAQSDQREYTSLIDMRIGRLLALMNKPTEAAVYLKRAWLGGDDISQEEAEKGRPLLCERLPLTWHEKKLDVSKVKANWMTMSETNPMANLYDCNSFK